MKRPVTVGTALVRTNAMILLSVAGAERSGQSLRTPALLPSGSWCREDDAAAWTASPSRWPAVRQGMPPGRRRRVAAV